MSGLYLHVPFCLRRCRYCAFASSVYEPAAARRYLAALEREALSRSETCARLAPDTVYVGGGTPTALDRAALRRICELAAAAGAPQRSAEMTAEANPCSTEPRRLALLREFGFNRLSLGAQSFDDRELELLGRSHRSAGTAAAVSAARRAGFESVGLDLIFGLPGQTPPAFLVSLERALMREPDHLSLYGLTYEAGTPLAADLAAGRVGRCSQETEREMYLWAVERLAAAGFRHYEIANFARPGHESRHNLNYWLGGEYLGLGAGACSYLGGERRGNLREVDAYCRSVESGAEPVAERERLAPEKSAREALMLGLRTVAGVELDEFRARTGFGALELFGPMLETHRAAGRLLVEGGRLRLTLEGLLVADSVMADFI